MSLSYVDFDETLSYMGQHARDKGGVYNWWILKHWIYEQRDWGEQLCLSRNIKIRSGKGGQTKAWSLVGIFLSKATEKESQLDTRFLNTPAGMFS